MASSVVYTGRWTDYSLTGESNNVITLSVRDGAILIAALSTFVGLVGTSFWSLMALWMHQSSARQEPQDGFYFQQQALYRNVGTPTAALLNIMQMCWAWRKPRRKPRRIAKLKSRSFVLALPPLIVFVGFTVAGVFVSKVAGKSYKSNNVLLKSGRCGYWSYSNATIQGLAAGQQKIVNDTVAARQYSTNCYTADNTTNALSTVTCDLYPLQALPYTTSNVTCPFGQDPVGDNLCLPSHNTAYQLSTPAFDSDEIFGINAPAENRITISKRLTCAPLNTQNYVNSTDPTEATYYFYLGQVFEVSNYTYFYNSQVAKAGIGYQITSVYADKEAWNPVDALQVSAGDVSLHFMAPNSVSYLTPVNDIFFSAHDVLDLDAQTTQAVQELYTPDELVSVMGCVDQYQICNPNSNPTSCTIFGTLNQMALAYKDINLNIDQLVTAQRMIIALELTTTYLSVSPISAEALSARNEIFGNQLSTGLPDYQWKIEVEGWFKTSLAKLQAYVIEYVSNSEDLGPYGSVVAASASDSAEHEAAVALCSQQRIRNTGAYQTFSSLGLLVIICVGLVIIVLNWILEPLIGCCRRLGRNRRDDYKEVARIADKTFQLQRIALSKVGDQGKWEKNLDFVPVTKSDTTFLPATRTKSDGAEDYTYEEQERPLIEQHFSKFER